MGLLCINSHDLNHFRIMWQNICYAIKALVKLYYPNISKIMELFSGPFRVPETLFTRIFQVWMTNYFSVLVVYILRMNSVQLSHIGLSYNSACNLFQSRKFCQICERVHDFMGGGNELKTNHKMNSVKAVKKERKNEWMNVILRKSWASKRMIQIRNNRNSSANTTWIKSSVFIFNL